MDHKRSLENTYQVKMNHDHFSGAPIPGCLAVSFHNRSSSTSPFVH